MSKFLYRYILRNLLPSWKCVVVFWIILLELIAVLVKIFKKICWNIFDVAAMSHIVLSVFRVLLPPPPRHTCMSIQESQRRNSFVVVVLVVVVLVVVVVIVVVVIVVTVVVFVVVVIDDV